MAAREKSVPVYKVRLQHSLDQGDGNGTQQVVPSHLVLCHAPYDIHQAGAFRKRSPAPAADRAIPSRMAYDDEVEEHHGKAGFHIPIVG